MSTRFLILVALVWATIGVVVAFLMRRRGHDFYVWLVLGVAFGPLVVLLAVESARSDSAAEYQPRGALIPSGQGGSAGG
ncbi:MAG: hypothetical protein ACC658_08020 [Acidimicrobiia bacterium]